MTASAEALRVEFASEAVEQAPLTGFVITYLLAVSSLAACGYLWGATGFELLIVGMGWPHIVLGFLFYANKLIRNEGPHRRIFYALIAITIAIGVVHSLKHITTLIYLYFIFHAFRDEIFIYHQRRTRHRYTGAVFDRRGLALLATVVLLALIGQLQLWPTLRTADIPIKQVQAGEDLFISFAPIEDSRGRDYYFSLVAPRSQTGMVFKGYGTEDIYSAGELILGTAKLSTNDAVFRLSYQEAARKQMAGAPAATLRDSNPLPVAESATQTTAPLERDYSRIYEVTGGQRFGQTFRAEADNLNGIVVAIEPDAEVAPDTKLTMRLEPAWFARYPYAYEAGLCGVFFILALLAVFKFPLKLFEQIPGLPYATAALFLVVAAMTAMKIIRYYELPSPLFFGFLVVFHYFSWYVFYFEKINFGRRTANATSLRRGFDRFLETISTRNGFLITIVVMNIASFGFAYAYYVLRLADGLRFAFDLKYFLYFLVFHVTMSFAPKRRSHS